MLACQSIRQSENLLLRPNNSTIATLLELLVIESMKKSITYDPHLSVADNAAANNMSISAMRSYLQRKGIDQNGDRQRLLFDKIHSIMDNNPSISIYRLAKMSCVDYKTAKRYATMIVPPNIQTGKESALRPGFGIVRSVYDHEGDLLNGIIQLYLATPSFEADMTYSKGGFYRHIPPPQFKFDIAPQFDDVLPLPEFDKLKDNSLGSVIIDLPYFAGTNAGKLYYAERYGQFSSIPELEWHYRKMMELATQKLKSKGLLVMKIQPFVYAERQVWTNYHIYNLAYNLNLEMVDEFVLVNHRRLIHLTGQQKHARRFHSYFLCFKKRVYKKDNKISIGVFEG